MRTVNLALAPTNAPVVSVMPERWSDDAFATALENSGRRVGQALAWEIESALRGEIAQAWLRLKDGDTDAACASFYGLRDLLSDKRLASYGERWIEQEQTRLVAEETAYRAVLEAAHRPGRRSVCVLTDSLGLHSAPASSPTYLKLLNAGKVFNVTPSARRFSTTESLVDDLDRLPVDGAVVVFHRGVNDYAIRIFSEEERRIVSGLPDPLRDTILRFVARCRVPLISGAPIRSYVSLSDFDDGLRRAAFHARDAGAARVAFVNIMRFPDRLTHIDPFISKRRLEAYNEAMREVCNDMDCNLIDMDRANVANSYRHVLSDYVHLNPRGHIVLASAIERLAGTA